MQLSVKMLTFVRFIIKHTNMDSEIISDGDREENGILTYQLSTFVSKALWYRTFKKIDCSLI